MRRILLTALLMFIVCGTANAGVCYFEGDILEGHQLWSDPNNWTDNIKPLTNSDVAIVNADPNTRCSILIDEDIDINNIVGGSNCDFLIPEDSGVNIKVQSIHLSNTAGKRGSWIQHSGSLEVWALVWGIYEFHGGQLAVGLVSDVRSFTCEVGVGLRVYRTPYGDTNGDGIVNLEDVTVLATNWLMEN
ncbi:MAG: hypothetical protein KAR40_06010 [Candidatus Sabulitectum sp.]|nr:hypothetical protein [Candidatus Sabulitectum sp.]